MSLRRPTAALLIYLHPFEESFQTLDQRILFLPPYCMFIFHLHACIQIRLLHGRRYHHKIFRSMITPLLYYTRVLNVCEYIQTYSLACPWLLSWPDSLLGDKHRGDNLGTYAVDVCSLAKIGVILVSCSCGKWSPIDADVSNRFRPQPLETKCCTPRPQWSCTTYFCTLLGILVSSWCLIS